MSDEGVRGPVKLPARVYPGVFPGEYQVTIRAGALVVHGKVIVHPGIKPSRLQISPKKIVSKLLH